MDNATGEWEYGVLSYSFRELSRIENNERKWLIFDGPVDAIWIENMNTVLDDNMKLCLNNGEIIQIGKNMNMIFEPMDLLVASPATVSRVGIIYYESADMGWKSIYKSWLNTLPKTMDSYDIQKIDTLFMWIIDPVLHKIRRDLKEISPTVNQNLVVSCLRLFRAMLSDFEDKVFYDKIEISQRLDIIDGLFIFSLYWSLGASVITKDRKTFDIFIRKLIAGDIPGYKQEINQKKIRLPKQQVYRFIYKRKDQETTAYEWQTWEDQIDESLEYDKHFKATDILVDTQDTQRYQFLLQKFIENEIPSLFCGPTGTGKTVYIKNVLNNILPKEKYTSNELGFSAQTSAMKIQNIIDEKLDKRGRGRFGPRPPFKMIIFVDDLNMPEKEEYGA